MHAGYDMEDAMILNKSAVERGLGHATMLKTEQVDLSKESGESLLCSSPLLCMHELHPFSNFFMLQFGCIGEHQ